MTFSPFKTVGLVAATALLATPAYAHDGDHSMGVFATVMHWLSSPTHSLFAVAAGAGIVVGLYALNKKRA